ncbi:phage portal protein [Schinkia azotoformans]|uniref:phage portal protein n=1 Tax=Schinkia azotoformans TaxID=1454 RepID=UPI002DBCA3B2|nr:phage portal protein [Schinkia azotoformans]MEC1716619.1 phage portal protein [Schinkia azotoformans]MEC1739457.1 phage portal protein [Schinkia azotoformans]MEC1745473.1 phage portal protein [Schinkia azotoformans]MEC1756536.1 phage portal protein [Schinkia azotoformans]MEC1765803.1 phage portal protein [Schinkia azotoformans]
MLIEDLYRRPYHEYLNDIIKNMVDGVISENEMIVQEIKEWLNCEIRKNMIIGESYYRNKTDIRDKKKRDVDWKSNVKLEHGFTKKLVDQKVGYLLTKEPTIASENKTYTKLLGDIFNRELLKTLKNTGKEAINKGIAYLYVYFNEEGELSFKRFKSEQILPFWKDDEHTELAAFIRVYDEYIYMNGKKEKQTKVEYHHSGGINFFILEGGKLVADVPSGINRNYHFTINEEPYLWTRIPLIPFKYNEEEQPLIDSIKSLIDNYNNQASTNADLLADIPNIIYKLVNYGGADLAEFLADLNFYRAVKLDEDGDVDKLQADPATDATEKELERTRANIYEFGRGLDQKDKDLGNASGKAMRHKYGDLDMDCNILESEFQSSIEHLIWFVNEYLLMIGKGDYTNVPVNFIFNRDIIINESEVIADCQASTGIIDDKTIRENHPWYTPEVESRLEEQKAKEQEMYDNYGATFNQNKGGGVDGQE